MGDVGARCCTYDHHDHHSTSMHALRAICIITGSLGEKGAIDSFVGDRRRRHANATIGAGVQKPQSSVRSSLLRPYHHGHILLDCLQV